MNVTAPEQPTSTEREVGGLTRAVDIAEKCGVTEPAFFGDVTIRIKGGSVSAVDVKRTFLP